MRARITPSPLSSEWALVLPAVRGKAVSADLNRKLLVQERCVDFIRLPLRRSDESKVGVQTPSQCARRHTRAIWTTTARIPRRAAIERFQMRLGKWLEPGGSSTRAAFSSDGGGRFHERLLPHSAQGYNATLTQFGAEPPLNASRRPGAHHQGRPQRLPNLGSRRCRPARRREPSAPSSCRRSPASEEVAQTACRERYTNCKVCQRAFVRWIGCLIDIHRRSAGG